MCYNEDKEKAKRHSDETNRTAQEKRRTQHAPDSEQEHGKCRERIIRRYTKMKNDLKCTDCCFMWKAEDERFPTCHWESRCPDDKPPCEYDDSDYEEPDYPDEAW